MEPVRLAIGTFSPDDPMLEWECTNCGALCRLTAAHRLSPHVAPRAPGHCQGCQCSRPLCPGTGRAPGNGKRLSIPGQKPLYFAGGGWFTVPNDSIISTAGDLA